MTGSQLRYCAKVGIAAALAYLLTLGNYNQYAVYGAFTAALVVGSNVGEDLGSSLNRVKGTLAGIAAGVGIALLAGPNVLTVGLAALLTAAISLGSGWGVAVARIGVSVCLVTLVMHDANALEYDLYRIVNTLVGVVVGLAVSLFVFPVHGKDEVERCTGDVVAAAQKLLAALERGESDRKVLRKLEGKLHDGMAATVKAWRDHDVERRLGHEVTAEEDRVVAALQLGLDTLSQALRGPDAEALKRLRVRLDELAGAIAK
ncbi:FUSC family protein [Usitatibacter palustris]|uniref:Integral membrane bound transporter domain-containing protein n=1 Tax=Usitatibacter palustris TaxID=2732487 RepID=A0A6M4H413_9PROT|nr:FUSC family protein [Usitatibacter palustris]QJR14319.1 hypothetical protein DSM104440_01115 [Usitatibacter palustris]